MKITEYPKVKEIDKSDVFIVDGQKGTRQVNAEDAALDFNELMFNSNWFSHRNIFRGKNLGSSFTEEQLAHIHDGSFKDLYVGDYWEVPGKDYEWQIADINYWTGSTEGSNGPILQNHIVVIPTKPIGTSVMMDSNIVTGGYIASKVCKEVLSSLKKSEIDPFFGANNIRKHRQTLSNAFYEDTNTLDHAIKWIDIDLPDTVAIYGNFNLGRIPTYNPMSFNKGQLASLRLNPENIGFDNNDVPHYWTRNISSKYGYLTINNVGQPATYDSNVEKGIRPIFAVG